MTKPKTRRKKHRVAALVYDGLCTFEFGIAAEIFALPRPEMGDDWYSFTTCALRTGALRANGGVKLVAEQGLSGFKTADTIVIPGWRHIDAPVPEVLLEALRKAHARGARLVSICSGAFVLAATGLLDGSTATTHWRYAEALRTRFPRVDVDASVLYVGDDRLLTSAGSAAGIDLLLHLVRSDFGAAVANQVARRLVMAPHRQGGQAQFIEHPVAANARGDLAPILDWMRRNLREPLTMQTLARKAAMSERTFLRRFKEATGATPGQWLIDERVEAAKRLLEVGRLPLDGVAAATGIGSVESLRHHFRSKLGVSPSAYRTTFKRKRASVH